MAWYYDSVDGRRKLKRRYVYAFWAGTCGFCAGVVITALAALA